uniref:Exonuclease domain-containing protein n=1 Tax=Chromera velia CCMP2878 TaxID=1169474 RepID=A0A0G4FGD4_9ALVE|eukprot:Cvel_16860.t1-p1 / transcript=Cvel_16860.t1 / gene=Cvel_16860 / organism=Chromera_velia_CCMP2878 / gene_product=hypothetical protein / transcript_product=hypothetical protein / location=Cvel_scaffold1318:30662-32560(-) / protein_length=368 / sequence_SO=supercontig / SO=protein_coding / is_pseudo=false
MKVVCRGRCVVLDLETNGFFDDKLRILEIGAVEMREGRVTGRKLSLLAHPDGVVDMAADWVQKNPAALGLLRDARARGENTTAAIEKLLKFIGTDPVVCHGNKRGETITVDEWTLNAEIRRLDFPFPVRRLSDNREVLDSMPFALRVAKEISDRGATDNRGGRWDWGGQRRFLPLADFCRMMAVTQGTEHRALSDAEATASCLQKALFEILGSLPAGPGNIRKALKTRHGSDAETAPGCKQLKSEGAFSHLALKSEVDLESRWADTVMERFHVRMVFHPDDAILKELRRLFSPSGAQKLQSVQAGLRQIILDALIGSNMFPPLEERRWLVGTAFDVDVEAPRAAALHFSPEAKGEKDAVLIVGFHLRR